MYAIHRITTYKFLEEFDRRIVHDSYVVGIPADRTAYMENQFGYEQQHRRHLVGSHFGRVIVSGIDGQQGLILGSISHTEFIGTDGIIFQTDTEYFRFQTGLHVIVFHREDLVQTLLKQTAVIHTIYGNIFATVVYPQVHDTGISLAFTHLFGNSTTTFGMLNPKITDSFVGIRERKIARFRV